MKRTEHLRKAFLAVSEGRPLDADGKAAAERMVSCGWLIRDRNGIYTTTMKGRKAFAASQSPPSED